jgi:hypothetical protein
VIVVVGTDVTRVGTEATVVVDSPSPAQPPTKAARAIGSTAFLVLHALSVRTIKPQLS